MFNGSSFRHPALLSHFGEHLHIIGAALLLRRTEGLRHTLDTVLAAVDVHDWDARDLADTPAEVLVAGGDDVAPVLLATLEETVVSISARVRTRYALETGILGQLECKFVFAPQLFELRHDAVRDAWDTLGKKTIHHTLVDFQLILDAEIDKVGIYQHIVRWTQLFIVLEKH